MKEIAFFLGCCCLTMSLVEGDATSPTKAPEHGNSTDIVTTHKPIQHTGNITLNGLNGSMIQRALYVLIGITIIGVLYFLVRAVR